MRLPWFKRPRPDGQVTDNRFTITMPGTKFKVTYHLTNGRLVGHSFTPGRIEDQKLKMSFSSFRSLAREAATAKARELGWISASAER
jgi:hypothetical protein